jgi:electron transfer flavoprotein alpha subunit
LYFAIGISGAVQHTVGMQNSEVVVAINRDEKAPIFQFAHYAIVGDLFKIVPAITAEVRKRRSLFGIQTAVKERQAETAASAAE